MNPVSAILLAGGRSSRMGTDKALLPFRGTTLLEWQLHKLKGMGIDDLLLSGRKADITGIRYVLDEIPHCGPLGGVCACLKQARHSSCLVLSVDAPLVPEQVLLDLVDTHQHSQAKITILTHDGKWEPLIGVYDCDLWHTAEQILLSGSMAVRRLLQTAGFETVPFSGDRSLLCNCNTPQDYELLCRRVCL